MPSPQFLLLVTAVLTCSVGCVGIAWYRCGHVPALSALGRRVFVVVLLLLAALTLLLAYQPQRGIIYLGLSVATLVIAMLWETPVKAPHQVWRGEPRIEVRPLR